MKASLSSRNGAVWVTGVGAYSAFGDVPSVLDAVKSGCSAVVHGSPPDISGLPSFAFAPAMDEPVAPYLRDRKMAKYMSPAAKMAVVAAGRALKSAGLFDDDLRREQLGLHVATGLIAFELSSVSPALAVCRDAEGGLDLQRLGAEGIRACPPLMPFKMLLNMSLGLVSIAYGIRGANFITYAGPDQSGICLEAAARAIRKGRCQRVLVGGTSQGVSLMPLATLMRTGRLALTPGGWTPMSEAHSGVATTDAAAFLVLESPEAAAERGATGLARVGDVLCRRVLPDGDEDESVPAWCKEASAEPPERACLTGSASYGEDMRDLVAISKAWPSASVPVGSLDGVVGWGGAAALPLAVGVEASRLAVDRKGRVLVHSRSSGEGRTILALEGGA